MNKELEVVDFHKISSDISNNLLESAKQLRRFSETKLAHTSGIDINIVECWCQEAYHLGLLEFSANKWNTKEGTHTNPQ